MYEKQKTDENEATFGDFLVMVIAFAMLAVVISVMVGGLVSIQNDTIATREKYQSAPCSEFAS